jgi:hypothetical protein
MPTRRHVLGFILALPPTFATSPSESWDIPRTGTVRVVVK